MLKAEQLAHSRAGIAGAPLTQSGAQVQVPASPRGSCSVLDPSHNICKYLFSQMGITAAALLTAWHSTCDQ